MDENCISEALAATLLHITPRMHQEGYDAFMDQSKKRRGIDACYIAMVTRALHSRDPVRNGLVERVASLEFALEDALEVLSRRRADIIQRDEYAETLRDQIGKTEKSVKDILERVVKKNYSDVTASVKFEPADDVIGLLSQLENALTGLERKEVDTQRERMVYDPATGAETPYPSNAADWRKFHGPVAWLYNPWTGEQRGPRDIGTDVHGLLVYSFSKNAIRATTSNA